MHEPLTAAHAAILRALAPVAVCFLLLSNLQSAAQATTLDEMKTKAAALALATPSVTDPADAAAIAEALGNAFAAVDGKDFGSSDHMNALLDKVQEMSERTPAKADAIAAAATAFINAPDFANRVAAVAATAAPGSASAIARAVSRAVPSASTAIAAAILRAVPSADGAAVAAAAQQGAAEAPGGGGGGGSWGGGSGGGGPYLPGGAGGGGGGGSGANPTPVPTPPLLYGR